MIADTRRESWDKILTDLGEKQAAVVRVFMDSYPKDFTPWEIADLKGWLVHAVRPRMTELEKLGVLEICGVRYYEPTDRNEHVYRLIEKRQSFDDDGQGALL